MKFELTRDQRDFAATLDDLLSAADTPAINRAWAAGDPTSGRALWNQLAELGVPALVIPESAGGLGASQTELVIACEALGRHAVPGPWIESAAWLPAALGDAAALSAIAEGTIATVAAPRALDGRVADVVYAVSDDQLVEATVAEDVASVDPTRRLTTVTPGTAVATGDLVAAQAQAQLACAAYLLGAGERLLADSVTYVKQRRQFGREIGSYQAIKHQLADVKIGLEFARPLVYAAALGDTPVAAAKVKASSASYVASRVGLQVHGAIGYTAECDLSIWILRVAALQSAWGTSRELRRDLLASLGGAR